MARFGRVLTVFPLLLAAACQPKVDPVQSAQTLLETDRAWATLVASNGSFDSIVGYWTADARVVLPGQPLLVGTEAIRGMVAGMRSIPGFRIGWTPDSAVVSTSGDVGYTFGTNSITAPDSTGTLRTMRGRYLTVWRKEPDGRWRCAFDISNEGPP